MKTCTKCLETKPFEDFAVRNTTRQRGQHYARCRSCGAVASLAWELKNKERALELRRAHYQRKGRDTVFRRKYGISLADRDALAVEQGNACAGCRSEFSLTATPRIDHAHGDGHVRGLLCHQCNVAIGLLKDDPARLRRLADYIEEK